MKVVTHTPTRLVVHHYDSSVLLSNLPVVFVGALAVFLAMGYGLPATIGYLALAGLALFGVVRVVLIGAYVVTMDAEKATVTLEQQRRGLPDRSLGVWSFDNISDIEVTHTRQADGTGRSLYVYSIVLLLHGGSLSRLITTSQATHDECLQIAGIMQALLHQHQRERMMAG